ncbi:MAG: hypothetical protein QM666_08940 [Acinetobacter sp.]
MHILFMALKRIEKLQGIWEPSLLPIHPEVTWKEMNLLMPIKIIFTTGKVQLKAVKLPLNQEGI